MYEDHDPTSGMLQVIGGLNSTHLALLCGRLCLKCDDTLAETRFRFSTKRTSPLNRWGRQFSRILASRGVRISGSIAG